MSEAQEDETIAAAMLLGAEFFRGPMHQTWFAKPPATLGSGDPAATRFYKSKRDAAVGYLQRRGYTVNTAGELIAVT